MELLFSTQRDEDGKEYLEKIVEDGQGPRVHALSLWILDHGNRMFLDFEPHPVEQQDGVGIGVVRGENILGKKPENLSVHALVAGSWVCEPQTRCDQQEQAEQSHAQGFQYPDVVERLLTQEPRADQDIAFPIFDALEKSGDAFRFVLSVPVHLDEIIVAS